MEESRPRAGGTVLLVEDEQSIGELVRTYLERDAFSVVWVRSGEAGLAELARHPVRLVVLDIGLPDLDGFEVCRRMRTRSSVPIIMLTARDEEPDRVAGLEVGADDYLTKPFSPRELVARVKAVLRRANGSARPETLTLGDIVVDRDGREVEVGGQRVDLTGKEFDLLAYLAARAGAVVPKRELLAEVWQQPYGGSDKTVDVHLSWLRRKLGENASEPRYLHTVRGVGVRLSAPQNPPQDPP